MECTDGDADPLCDAFGTSQVNNDIWYCWTSDTDGAVEVTTVGLTGIDTRLAVYDGCGCPSGSPGGTNAILACNDDSDGSLQSTASWDAVNGNTYLIRVGTFSAAVTGMGQFLIQVAPTQVSKSSLLGPVGSHRPGSVSANVWPR